MEGRYVRLKTRQRVTTDGGKSKLAAEGTQGAGPPDATVESVVESVQCGGLVISGTRQERGMGIVAGEVRRGRRQVTSQGRLQPDGAVKSWRKGTRHVSNTATILSYPYTSANNTNSLSTHSRLYQDPLLPTTLLIAKKHYLLTSHVLIIT
jgi:hypothetical protein